jgi:CDP-paratose 2-epimerase
MNVLITGGCGFIGTNLAEEFILRSDRVTLFDNLSRAGSEKNLAWLKKTYPKKFEFIQGDVRNYDQVKQVVNNKEAIFHFAAQVAVTTSVSDPRSDFENNILGTFNVLEAARESGKKPFLLYSSTNKVYGEMEDLVIEQKGNRYLYQDFPQGIDEFRPLDFHSPYGCSKGAADQYFRDYSRIYDIPTVVFRMSCIYGPHQFGNEDQGWVAHFAISAMSSRSLTIWGDGKQVRDVLFVKDLCHAFISALENKQKTKGQIFNIGGGPKNTLSLLELIDLLEKEINAKISLKFTDWRPGDQKVYISNPTKAKEVFGWEPTVTPEKGVKKIIFWLKNNPDIVEKSRDFSSI